MDLPAHAGSAERIGELATRFIPDIEQAMEALLVQSGAWTKARADTLNSLNRLLTDFLALSRSAAEKKRAAEENDHDIAAVLAAIDRRILELASAFSGRVGDAQPRPSEGGQGGA